MLAQVARTHAPVWRRRQASKALPGILLGAALLSACGGGTSGATSTDAQTSTAASGAADSGKALKLAFLSFAVQNSYDAPMLAAARDVAGKNNASLTVFDANNSAQTQFTQVQDAVASGKYDGIIVQPVDGAGLVPQVQSALAKKIKVVAMDQVLGPDLTKGDIQVPGVSAYVGFVPSVFGEKMGTLAGRACASLAANPCNIGYLYDVKASSNGQATRAGFNKGLAGTPDAKVVAEGETFFTADGGLKAAQTMLQAHPTLNVIIGSDQGAQGASQAVAAIGKTGKVLLNGNGGSAAGYKAIQAGTIFGTVTNLPASEGRGAVEALIKALRAGQNVGFQDPSASLPDNGIVTKDNVTKFKAEWSG